LEAVPEVTVSESPLIALHRETPGRLAAAGKGHPAKRRAGAGAKSLLTGVFSGTDAKGNG